MVLPFSAASLRALERWTHTTAAALRVPRPHEWVLLGLLLFMTDHYRWLMDDAFIYFRYLDNLLFLDRGLVFNEGEYVEGYSSPLWLLVLSPMRALGLDYYALVRALALLCAAAYGGLLIAVNGRLSPSNVRVNFPLAASAAHYGLTTHFSSGLETPLVQVLGALFGTLALWPRSRTLQGLAGLAVLVRHELALPLAIYALGLWIHERRFPHVLVLSAAGTTFGWLLFRVYYYADFLPNTFYLKDTTQYRQGYDYWANIAVAHHWPWVLLVVLALAVLGRRALVRETLLARALMLLAAVAYGLYVLRIGGDMLYHRYASFSVALGLCACGGIAEAAVARLPSAQARSASALAATCATALFFGACYPPQLASHPYDSKAKHQIWRNIADSIWHRRHKQLRYSEQRAEQDRKQRARYAAITRAQRRHDGVLVTGFCRKAYNQFDKYVVHDLALTDALLSRMPAPFGRPGHKLVSDISYRLAELHAREGVQRGRGLVDRWLAKGPRPRFLRRNKKALRVLEKKIYNRHDFTENLELAFSRVKLRR